MRGHVRKRGQTWAFVVDLDGQRAQRCTGCRARSWVERERPAETCSTCGALLAEPRFERRQIWKSGFGTRKAAEKSLRELLARVDAGREPLPADITTREWSTRWLASERVQRLRQHTQDRYRQVLADRFLPTIGAMRLVDVRPRHLRAALDTMAVAGLSGRSVNEARNVASTMFRAAVEDELIETNPATAVRAVPHRRRHLATPTTTDLATLVCAAEGTNAAMPIALGAYLGLRRSEVLGLRWRDIDLDAGILHVRQGLQRVRTGVGRSSLTFLGLKTDNSVRQLDLGPGLVERLRQHRREQAERRLRLGTAWVDLDLVCDRGDGGPRDPDAFSRLFKRLAARAGLPNGVRLHDVRHGVATAMLAGGVDMKIASAVLGHSSADFTRDQYAHVLSGMTAAATTALDAMLSR